MRHTFPKVLLLFCGVFTANVTPAGGVRIALLANAEVQGDAILLASLLPPNAPRAVQDVAKQIVLGSAPQNGAARRLSIDTIAAAIQDAGLSPTSFLVPETVTVRRRGRFLTSQEAWTAIQTFLAKHPVNALRALRPEDLTLDAEVTVSGDNAKPVVTRLTFDDVLHRARFRLRLQSVAASQPFYVTARIPSQAIGAAHPSFREAASLSETLDSSAHSTTVLVDPRQSARLHLHSTDSEMLLEVQPLQRGHLDETIRVRLRSSGKTLQARVVGENALDAAF